MSGEAGSRAWVAELPVVVGPWLFACIWLFWGLWIHSNVVPDMFAWIAWSWCGLILSAATAITLAALVVRLARWRRFDRPVWLGALAFPIVAAAFVVLATFEVPFRARFEASRGALEEFAQSLPAGEKRGSGEGARRVGLFSLSEYHHAGVCVRMITGEDFVDHVGLAYCPGGERPPIIGEDSYEHIDGPWWKWYRSW